MKHYEQERDIKVYRADDCINRNGDCDGAGSYKLRCSLSNVKM